MYNSYETQFYKLQKNCFIKIKKIFDLQLVQFKINRTLVNRDANVIQKNQNDEIIS